MKAANAPGVEVVAEVVEVVTIGWELDGRLGKGWKGGINGEIRQNEEQD